MDEYATNPHGPSWPHHDVTRAHAWTPAQTKHLRRPYTLARDAMGEIYGRASLGNVGNDPFTRSVLARNPVTDAAGEMLVYGDIPRAPGQRAPRFHRLVQK